MSAFLIPSNAPLPTAETSSPQDQDQVEVIPASRTATSTELRGMAPPPVSLAPRRKIKRIRLNPNVLVSLAPAPRDPVLQSSVSRPRRTSRRAEAPVRGKNLEGIGDGFKGPQGAFLVHGAPPDTSGAVGDTQYVQFVNESFAVFNKTTGKIELGPVLGKMLWRSLGGNCADNNDGDPVVQFDKIARRWVLSQFSVNNGFSQCVAVSTTSDATGTYHLYEFTYPAFNDYPKMGVWPDGYYISFNIYNDQDRFIGSRACVYEREKMLKGSPARQQCFQLSSTFFGLLPSDLDGATASIADADGNANGPAAPPAGAPNYFVAVGRDSRSLDLWKFHVDWETPANSTFGINPSHRPNTIIPVARFTFTCNGSGQDCVPQPGAKDPEELDTLGERLMFRLAYRRFPTHESLLLSHSVDSGPPKPRSGVRWYELRDPNAASPAVFQQSTYAPDANHRWMSSIAMDKVQNLAVGYSASSKTTFPGIRYATRSANDPLDRLGPEIRLKTGQGTQRCKLANGRCLCPMQDDQGNPELDDDGKVVCDTVGRWGDYSSMTVDPTDDCTFWFTSEYLSKTGAFNWHTRIGSFKLPSCR